MAAGIIITTRFIQAGSASSKGQTFSGYLGYMDRPEAAREAQLEEYDIFKTYLDYMGNPEKSSGLFSGEKDYFSDQEIEKLKAEFDRAQEKGSNLYQGIISFETDWLKAHGLVNKDGIVVENKLREYTRRTMDTMLKEEAAANWIWTAAIHFNTEHYHIHITMVDPDPSWKENVGRCRMDSETGTLYQRGKFKLHSIEKAKSTFVNLAIDSKEKNILINDIVRDRIVLGKRLNKFADLKNPQLQKQFEMLLRSLPEDMRLWKYDMNAMMPYRKQIDALSDMFIKTYFQADYEEFKKVTQELAESYSSSYGDSSRGTNFYEEKEADLYYRLGNAILKECREVNKSLQNNVAGSKHKLVEHRYYKYNNRRLYRELRDAFRKSIANMKNQAAYERLLEEEQQLMDR